MTLLGAVLGRLHKKNNRKEAKNTPKSQIANVLSEKNKGGWKTQGRGKHAIKPLPKNGFGPPHL